MKLKLRPLSELNGDQRWEYKLFVWVKHNQICFCKLDCLVGIYSAADWGNVGVPDGWCDPIEIEVDEQEKEEL
jgi:hypothetical protein